MHGLSFAAPSFIVEFRRMSVWFRVCHLTIQSWLLKDVCSQMYDLRVCSIMVQRWLKMWFLKDVSSQIHSLGFAALRLRVDFRSMSVAKCMIKGLPHYVAEMDLYMIVEGCLQPNTWFRVCRLMAHQWLLKDVCHQMHVLGFAAWWFVSYLWKMSAAKCMV